MPDRIEPQWFRYIKQGAGVSNMASPDMPDVRKKILHVRRGMRGGELFDWTEPPAGSLKSVLKPVTAATALCRTIPRVALYHLAGPVILRAAD